MGKKYVVMGATVECSNGAMSGKLIVIPHMLFVKNKPVANATDCMPFVNILPFGTCKMIQTPAGPGPCVPAPTGTWLNTKTDITVQGQQLLVEGQSKLTCALGGIIELKDSGQ